MRSVFLCTFGCLLLLPAAVQADDKAEWKKLQGTYQLKSAKRGGKDAPPAILKMKLAISEGKFTIITERNGMEKRWVTIVKIDFSKKPTQIDFLGKDDKVREFGILKLEATNLTICSVSKAKRPEKFESKAGSRITLLIFSRIKSK